MASASRHNDDISTVPCEVESRKDTSSGGPDADSVDADWEQRLASGNLPEDFLKVTEPLTSGRNDIPPPVQPGNTVAELIPHMTDLSEAKVTSRTAEEVKESYNPKAISTVERDHEIAVALQKQLNIENTSTAIPSSNTPNFYAPVATPNVIGRLTITVVQARLAKNYGLTRMDPYCRIRVGHSVYETTTHANGSTNPSWNKTFNCLLIPGVRHIDLEILDECTFSSDAQIAQAIIELPAVVVAGKEAVDQWWPLSGPMGIDKEGSIHLIISLFPVQTIAMEAPRCVSNTNPEFQIEELCKIFPILDREIIISVFNTNNGNKESAVNSLLAMCQDEQ